MSVELYLSAEELEQIKARMIAWKEEVADVIPSFEAFTIITPLGLLQIEALEKAFAQFGIEPLEKLTVSSWPRLGTFVYAKTIIPGHVARALIYEKVWERYEPEAQIWTLSRKGFEDITASKQEIRNLLEKKKSRMSTSAGDFNISLHPFHVPDDIHLYSEAQTASHYLKK